jgi:pyridoxal phosphate enzyme (YggS family)
MSIAENLAQVRAQIAQACQEAGRDASDVGLIAVSKTMPPALILEAVAAGQVQFGENRIEEAALKIPQVGAGTPTPLHWHMIGHIQSRKAKDLLAAPFGLIHSVDSLKLAQRLSRLAGETGQVANILLEINVSGESSKSGLSAFGWEDSPALRAALWTEVAQVMSLPHLNLRGLMTMAPYEAEPEATRPVFRALARLRAAWQADFPAAAWRELSMGMSNDFAVAIQEGATLVRIGRAIFGDRPAA